MIERSDKGENKCSSTVSVISHLEASELTRFNYKEATEKKKKFLRYKEGRNSVVVGVEGREINLAFNSVA